MKTSFGKVTLYYEQLTPCFKVNVTFQMDFQTSLIIKYCNVFVASTLIETTYHGNCPITSVGELMDVIYDIMQNLNVLSKCKSPMSAIYMADTGAIR